MGLGVKERRKEREKPKPRAAKELEEKPDRKAADTSKEIDKPKTETRFVEVAQAIEELKEAAVVTEPSLETQAEAEEALMPHWGDISQSEWMYAIPPREEDMQMWAEEWGDFLLEWAEKNNVHVMSVTTFLTERPFKDMNGKVDSFKLIGDGLVDKEIAEWLDKARRQLRVYWRFLEDWADIIYKWALETGTVRLDIKSIVIQENDQAFSTLPEKDLFIVMTLLVEKGLAEWIDKKKGAIKILL
ncbi:MAG: hypothetical protein ACFFAY_09160 [Promethearchaeota archaeon]